MGGNWEPYNLLRNGEGTIGKHREDGDLLDWKTTPLKFNMVHLKISHWKRRFFLESNIFRFHVKFWGCTCLFGMLFF